jgi:signal transduction histidine kinase
MINDITGKVVLASVNILIHLGILAVYHWEGKWEYYPLSWSYPYTIFILIMMCLSTAMPFINRPGIRIRLLAFRMLITAILAVPSSNDILSFGFIFALIIFEGFLYLPRIVALMSALLCIMFNIVLANLHISLWFKPSEALDAGSLMVTFGLYALCGGTGYYLAREQSLRAEGLKTLKELRESNASLASINISLQHVAASEKNITLTTERNRIAREIHDTVAYTLTNLLSLLDAYRERLQADAQEVPENIIQARSLVREGLGDIRKVLRGLRPGENEGYNGLGSITHLVEVFTKAAGIKVILNYGDAPQFPGKAIEDVFYRVVQEGLTNAFRHGHATEVVISFHDEQSGIELTVRDNGQGSEITTGGYGLLGIGERVKALDGKVVTISKPGLGFTLRVWLPLERGDEEHGTDTAGHSG